MARPRLYRTEAVVLKRTDLGEADKIVTLYTPHLGKLRAVAKGVRRPLSKLGGHVELFTHSQMLLAKGRNLDIVTQSETIHSFIGLREDLVRTTMACCVAELIDKLTPDGVESNPVFDLLIRTLDRLATAADPEVALRLFEVVLLGHLGYRPELHTCVGCRTVVGPEGNYFSASVGGVLCPKCGRAEPTSRPMGVNALKVLRLLQSGDYTFASKLRLADGIRREVESIVQSCTQFALESDLKSGQILRSLETIASTR